MILSCLHCILTVKFCFLKRIIGALWGFYSCGPTTMIRFLFMELQLGFTNVMINLHQLAGLFSLYPMYVETYQ